MAGVGNAVEMQGLCERSPRSAGGWSKPGAHETFEFDMGRGLEQRIPL